MNWRKVDECWKAFASDNKLKFDQSDDNFLYGVRTEYELTLTRPNYSLTFLGDMKKSTEGYNRYRTKLFIKELKSNCLNFDEVIDSRFLFIFKNHYKDLIKADLLELIRKHNAHKIIRMNFGFEIRYDYLFDKSNDFLDGIKLADEIAKRASRYHHV